MATRIDTLAITKRLETGGFSRDQSEVVANVLNEGYDMALKELATRDDVQRAIQLSKDDLAKAVAEQKSAIVTAVAEQKAAIAEASNRQTIWTVATMIAVAGAAIAITRFL